MYDFSIFLFLDQFNVLVKLFIMLFIVQTNEIKINLNNDMIQVQVDRLNFGTDM